MSHDGDGTLYIPQVANNENKQLIQLNQFQTNLEPRVLKDLTDTFFGPLKLVIKNIDTVGKSRGIEEREG